MSRADVVYLVSRFPLTSETFIVREIDAVDRLDRFDLELRSLFPSPDNPVHDVARRWTERLIRPSAGAALAGAGWAALTRPRALFSVLAAVLVGYRRRPALLVRARHDRRLPRPEAALFAHLTQAPLAGESVRVDFELDKSMPPSGADLRDLGLVVLSAGLDSK